MVITFRGRQVRNPVFAAITFAAMFVVLCMAIPAGLIFMAIQVLVNLVARALGFRGWVKVKWRR